MSSGKARQTADQRPLRARLATYVDLRIPHFLRSMAPGTVAQLAFDDRSTEQWYYDALTQVASKIGAGHYPVFRFSDGEGLFTMGYKFPPVPPGVSAPVHYIRTFLSVYVKHRQHKIFRSGTRTSSYETYAEDEWSRARDLFPGYLRDISIDGMLACNFGRHPEPFGLNQSLLTVLDWMDQHGVVVNYDNYVPFYFLYAMLIGPDRHLFLRNKRILVVTGLTPERQTALDAYFQKEGAASVEYLSVSASKSMFDRVDLGQLRHGVDVALIGAGVGASNILLQLKPLKTLCIDAGHVLDCYREPATKGTRIFTLPDEEL